MIQESSARRRSSSIGVAVLASVVFGCLPALASPEDTSSETTSPQPREASKHIAAKDETAKDADEKVDYAKQIQPLLAKRCYACHGPKKQEGALRLDVRSAAMRGGELGPAIVPDKSEESLLIKAVSGESDEVDQMPQEDDSLTADEVKLLRDWIDQGASWPDDAM